MKKTLTYAESEARRLHKNKVERDRRARIKAASLKFKPVQVQPQPVGTVNVALVLDASGSMYTLRDKAVQALNRQVENLRRVTRETGQRTLVSLYTFSDQGNLRQIAKQVHPDLVPDVTRGNYYPNGQTVLLDAINDVSADLSVADDGARRTSFLVVVFTDGQENDSFTSRFSVQSLIRQKQSTDRWTFALSVPPGGRSYAEALGIPSGNIQEWEATELGLERATSNVVASTSSYYAGQARGVTATKSFFTDLSKVTDKDLQKLDDLSFDFKHWLVKDEAEIRPFVEAHGIVYQIGKAFYQLTKTEKVQDHKDFVIRDKTTKKLYGGDQARQLVGLSRDHREVRVNPGNHANFDLFVQSTSTNRKLVRGTTLLYRVR